jgi:hypothetical protein
VPVQSPVQEYVYDPDPPDTEEVNDTVCPISAGFGDPLQLTLTGLVYPQLGLFGTSVYEHPLPQLDPQLQ